jgi:hypothetical protein
MTQIIIKTENKADHYSAAALLQKLSGLQIHLCPITVEKFNDDHWKLHPLVKCSYGYICGVTDQAHTHSYPQDIQKIVDHFIKPTKEYIVTGVGDYKAEISDKGIKVGCQLISFAKFDEIASKLKDFRNGV